ncbi:hypothetical protein TYRP_012750 [Tyrophagus putrescentiae]|nr:hypothetical protein TYRP_012750 [Tyrophagus putrescentiae]
MVLFQLLMNAFFFFFLFHFDKLRGVAALGEQVYQPVPSEIDRFKMIQEKIHQAENQEQNNLVVEEEEQLSPSSATDRCCHPSSADLCHVTPTASNVSVDDATATATAAGATFTTASSAASPGAEHSTFITTFTNCRFNQQQHFPVLPQFPQVSPTIHHQLAAAQPHQVGGIVGDPLEGIHSGGQQLQLQQSVAGSSLSSAPHLHPETYQTLMQKNLVLPGEVPPSSIDKHHLETMNSGGGGGGDEHVGMETKGDEKDRDDRGRGDQHRGNSHHGGGGGSLLAPRRCYACSWSIAQCADFNCYNNPDICTNNHFRAHKVQQEDCPSGCEQYVVTDPNGLIQMWKRGCAPPSLPIKGYRCKTHYEFGIRIDRCICNQNWCNLAPSLHRGGGGTFLYLLLPCFSLLLHWLLLNRILL